MTEATRYADLEIGLHRRQEDAYAVDMRFELPGSDADSRSDDAQARFDLNALRGCVNDPTAYGQNLTESLFKDSAARSAFERARDLARSQTPPLALRVRLAVGPTAPELHPLLWETLCEPGTAGPLAMNENILFSRFLASRDWAPVRPRSKSDLRALVVAANPRNLDKYGLAAVDVTAELSRAKAGLGSTVPVTTLPTDGPVPHRATLNEITAALRDAPYDILYLVCHGALKNGEPWLWLEDDTGQAEPRTLGQGFIDALRDLAQRPRFIILASCQSAGAGTGPALLALGPRLAEAGVPAVLAMQGSVSMDTVAAFMPRFFEALLVDGQIDRALAVARGAVRGRSDWWMPALFSRLKSGQIWYVPGFSVSGRMEQDTWVNLKDAIRDKHCTPILGPGLVELWLGQTSQIAERWAAKYQYPLAPDDRDQLPRVAQYVSRRLGAGDLRREYQGAIRAALLQYDPGAVSDELAAMKTWAPTQILKALHAAAERRWASATPEPHALLADLRLPIYITTNPDDLLAQALIKRGAKPEVRLCPWWGPSGDELQDKCLYDGDPTEQQPLVYHLFGRLDTPDSLVLSEDNFFDFLIGYTRQKANIPAIIRDALTSTNLLFLGFRTDDWGYRVLFRTLIAQKGSAQLRENKHVSAQVEPDEGRLLDVQRARRYLEETFTKDNIDIYWGRSEDFLNALALQRRSA